MGGSAQCDDGCRGDRKIGFAYVAPQAVVHSVCLCHQRRWPLRGSRLAFPHSVKQEMKDELLGSSAWVDAAPERHDKAQAFGSPLDVSHSAQPWSRLAATARSAFWSASPTAA